MWRLHEQALSVEGLGASHQGVILVKVLHCVVQEYDRTQKVSIFLFFELSMFSLYAYFFKFF